MQLQYLVHVLYVRCAPAGVPWVFGSCCRCAWLHLCMVLPAPTAQALLLQVVSWLSAELYTQTTAVLLQVVDIPNSMTVLPELIPLSIQMVSGGS